MSGSVAYYDGATIRTTTAGTAGQILVSQGTSTPIFQNAGLQTYDISALVVATPYTVGTEYFIPVDTGTLAITVQLPNAPATGQVYIVKDAAGNAASNNITVTTPGGTVNIDGGTSFAIATNWQAVQFIFNGTQYYSF